MGHNEKIKVLFVCVGNACRSPMAEAIARHEASDVLDASSAGLFPMGMIPEMTRQTLESNGYSAEGLESKGLQQFSAQDVDLVLNLSGHQGLLIFDRYRVVEEWKVADPYGEDGATYQRILEDIQGRVKDLARRLRDEQRKTRREK
jgi:arsenate reductase (thioredoxin)